MTLTRRALLAAGLAVGIATSALAGAKAPYSQASFDAAKAAGKPILVEVSAPWCPTCKAQAPIIGALSGEARFKDLQTFTVDFDSQKDALKSLNVQMQSTLIVFKGGKEVGRSTGDTKKASIEALLAKAL
ncbi:MAG: thioredoxin family protein [Hyphomicrobiaceae bacterium]|nr:thioredoxin family protein [Hyphomicrobiaceae bacterium]